MEARVLHTSTVLLRIEWASLDIECRRFCPLPRHHRYATSPELNSWTPLIHDEYANLAHTTSTHSASGALSAITNAAQLSAPIHLTLDVSNLQIKAYASEKLGLANESVNRTFVPLETEMKVAKNEQAGREWKESIARKHQTRAKWLQVCLTWAVKADDVAPSHLLIVVTTPLRSRSRAPHQARPANEPS